MIGPNSTSQLKVGIIADELDCVSQAGEYFVVRPEFLSPFLSQRSSTEKMNPPELYRAVLDGGFESEGIFGQVSRRFLVR
jgi:hypothetical protein